MATKERKEAIEKSKERKQNLIKAKKQLSNNNNSWCLIQ